MRSKTSLRSARRRNSVSSWIDSIKASTEIRTIEDRRNFLLNLICFACCIEGLFFFRGVCICVFSAVARIAARAGHRDKLGVSRRERAHPFRVSK